MLRALVLVLGLLAAPLAQHATAQAVEKEAIEKEEPIDIEWGDLIPEAKDQKEQDSRDQLAAAMSEFLGAGHSAVTIGGAGPGLPGGGEALVETFDDKRVRMPGYALPLDWSEEGFTQFLLVPYVGACVHVPPPPANQLVLIETEKPYKPSYIFEPVSVTGVFSRFEFEIGDVASGYRIVADSVGPYEE